LVTTLIIPPGEIRPPTTEAGPDKISRRSTLVRSLGICETLNASGMPFLKKTEETSKPRITTLLKNCRDVLLVATPPALLRASENFFAP
jgi:hypothetical protein